MEHETVRELSAAYALNALGPQDEREFEAHLAGCASCREELAAFQEVAAALAYDVEAPPPPPALKARILEQARSERPNVVPLRPRWAFPAAAALAAAAACAAIGLGVWAASLRGSLGEERAALADQSQVVTVLSAANAERVPLEGRDGSLVVGPEGQAVLLVSNLEAAPAGKTYEAWVIEDGDAKPAGIFDGGGDRTAFPLERRVPRGAAVAVTVEADGGVQKPAGRVVFSTQRVPA